MSLIDNAMEIPIRWKYTVINGVVYAPRSIVASSTVRLPTDLGLCYDCQLGGGSGTNVD